MKVKAVLEFDADVSDIFPEYVDVEGFAKDLTKRELADLISNSALSADDFEYEVSPN